MGWLQMLNNHLDSLGATWQEIGLRLAADESQTLLVEQLLSRAELSRHSRADAASISNQASRHSANQDLIVLQDVELTAQVKMVELEAHLSVQHELQELKSRVVDLQAQADDKQSQSLHASGTAPGQDQVREVQPINGSGCNRAVTCCACALNPLLRDASRSNSLNLVTVLFSCYLEKEFRELGRKGGCDVCAVLYRNRCR